MPNRKCVRLLLLVPQPSLDPKLGKKYFLHCIVHSGGIRLSNEIVFIMVLARPLPEGPE